MRVTGASAGPIEKSVPLTGGKSEVEAGAGVGSVKIAEQLISVVGVSMMVGFSTKAGEFGGISVFEEQAFRMKIEVIAKINGNKNCFIYWFTAFCNCSKLVIKAIVFTKSAREALCSRKARTAGPTGSSPAAPPGELA